MYLKITGPHVTKAKKKKKKKKLPCSCYFFFLIDGKSLSQYMKCASAKTGHRSDTVEQNHSEDCVSTFLQIIIS